MDSKIIELVKKWFNKTENWQKDSFASIWKGSNNSFYTQVFL